ncbi:hypothetical protein L210DRAFT_3574561 [Boletus edulis BED1]|uniref:Uncharacterized protein n=1 Tax=Boletus edulis BED1 TaxID=1328754 RepID=A0AAD4BDM1_BOLED|nr:hypothetical protein L210DRAFT_3574561 [Boletus edulis BED1]
MHQPTPQGILYFFTCVSIPILPFLSVSPTAFQVCKTEQSPELTCHYSVFLISLIIVLAVSGKASKRGMAADSDLYHPIWSLFNLILP